METLYICLWKQLVHGLGCVFKTYWFDAHTAMPREGTTAMTSRKDVTKRWSSTIKSGKFDFYIQEGNAIGTSTWVIYYWSLTLVVYTYV